MSPALIAQELGISSKEVRQYARKHFTKNGKQWNFTEDQVNQIRNHFGGQAKAATVATPEPAPTVTFSTLTDLKRFAESWLQETYGLSLTVPLEINSRLARTLGRFQYNRLEQKPKKVELAQKLLKYHDKETVIDVLKHELVHYACYVQGHPHSDGDWYFENELKRLGIGRTGTISRKGLVHQYCCTSCGKIVSNRYRRISQRKLPHYYTNCCKADLKYNGQAEI